MAEQWYYTANGQQLGPVSYPELQQLAASGQLAPADLVWTDGMHQWAPAGTTRGLFPTDAPASAPSTPLDTPAPRGEPALDRGEPVERSGPPRRRRAPAPAGSARAAVIGGVIGGVLLLVAVVLVIVLVNRQPADVNVPIVNGRGAYTVRLNHGERNSRSVQFTAGRQVTITVLSDFNTDVDLNVFDAMGNLVASDHRGDRNCFVSFFPQRTEFYRLELVNLGPGSNRCVVRCE